MKLDEKKYNIVMPMLTNAIRYEKMNGFVPSIDNIRDKIAEILKALGILYDEDDFDKIVRDIEYKDRGISKVDHVNFNVHSGEILGIAGVQGNGQEELIKSITGLLPFQKGTVKLDGVEIANVSIHEKRASGLSYIPEDRMIDGIAGSASIQDNLISTYLSLSLNLSFTTLRKELSILFMSRIEQPVSLCISSITYF